MKPLTCFLLLALAAGAFSYPASSGKESHDLSDDAEFIVVPLERQRPNYFHQYPSSYDGFDGVVDTAEFPHLDERPIFFPSVNPFTWQLSGYFDDLIKRVRDRFAGSWNPFYGDEYLPNGPGLWPVEIDDSAEDGVANSTSTVKVIDGHKVVINDTYYTKKTGFGTSIFKVRVINVLPTDEESGEKKPEGEKPTDVDTSNRNGSDGDDDAKKEEPATEAPKRDTEQDSSDEENPTVDDSANAIDVGTDIDEVKNRVGDSAKPEQRVDSAVESFEDVSLPLERLNISPENDAVERHNKHSEILESSAEDDVIECFIPDEWQQYYDDRRRIIVPTNSRPQFPMHSESQLEGNSNSGTGFDLSNDIVINYKLADQGVTAHPEAEVFQPSAARPAQDPAAAFPNGGGFPQRFPGVGFPLPSHQQPNQFPLGAQFPVTQTFPGQQPVFGVQRPPVHPNFGRPQMPIFFGSPQFPQAQFPQLLADNGK